MCCVGRSRPGRASPKRGSAARPGAGAPGTRLRACCASRAGFRRRRPPRFRREAGSFLAWGDFNAAFEKKEYIEDYVLEPFARELLERDPAVRAELERRLAAHPTFAKDPQARLELFHRRHPSFDEAYRLDPVLRTETRP